MANNANDMESVESFRERARAFIRKNLKPAAHRAASVVQASSQVGTGCAHERRMTRRGRRTRVTRCPVQRGRARPRDRSSKRRLRGMGVRACVLESAEGDTR